MKENFAISVRELTKRFNDFTAVNAITFDVKQGEIFGFLGANGAGKTTARFGPAKCPNGFTVNWSPTARRCRTCPKLTGRRLPAT